MESPVRQPDLQPVEPRVELPGEESGRLWVELLVKRPPDASIVTYTTLLVNRQPSSCLRGRHPRPDLAYLALLAVLISAASVDALLREIAHHRQITP